MNTEWFYLNSQKLTEKCMNEFQICKSIRGYGIGQICLLLAKNYTHWSLFLWKNDSSNDECICNIYWVLYLQKYNNSRGILIVEYVADIKKSYILSLYFT